MLPRRFHIDGGVVIEDFFACQNRWFRDGLLGAIFLEVRMMANYFRKGYSLFDGQQITWLTYGGSIKECRSGIRVCGRGKASLRKVYRWADRIERLGCRCIHRMAVWG